MGSIMHIRRNFFRAALAASLAAIFPLTALHAEDALSYVDGSQPFVAIKDVNQQSLAWATCAAAYDIFGTFSEPGSARRQKMENLSYGAKTAVIMALLSIDLKSGAGIDRLKASWTKAEAAVNEIPKRRRTAILADAEALGSKQRFLKKMAATVEICINNLDAQQMYIDEFRELAKRSAEVSHK
jgi:hypothetical protein